MKGIVRRQVPLNRDLLQRLEDASQFFEEDLQVLMTRCVGMGLELVEAAIREQEKFISDFSEGTQ